MSENFQKKLLEEASNLLQPLVIAAENEDARARLFSSLGWDLQAITGFPINNLQSCLSELTTAYVQIENWIDAPPSTLDELLKALKTVQVVVQSIEKLDHLLDGSDLIKPEGFEKLTVDLIELLAVNYLAARHPQSYALASLATVIADGGPTFQLVIDPATNFVIRQPVPKPGLHLDRISKLLQDPVTLLKAEYMPNGMATYADAQQAADKLFPRLAIFLGICGIRSIYGLNPAYGISFGSGGNEVAQLSMGFLVPFELESVPDNTGFGAILAFSPADRGDLGLVISPFGRLVFEQAFENWSAKVRLEGGQDGFAIHPRHGIRLPNNAQDGRIVFNVQLNKLANETGPALLIGNIQDTRLEIGQFAIKGEANLSTNQQDYGFLFEVRSAAIVISAGDGDGFLQQVLPEDGIHIDFDLAIGWSNKKGLYFGYGAGLEANLLINKELFGVLKIDSVYLAILAKGSDIKLIAASSVTLRLGPLTAAIEQMGLQATLSFPEKGGNLGPVNLELGFKPPNGAGLAIDASIVVGAGFLKFDEDKQLYYGLVHLEIAEMLNVTAVGLITTRMPDGSPGFSLLALVAVQFAPPIQLGYGFTLNGLGGILGVNRTASVEVLRSGLRTGTLGSVLFPVDPVNNAMKIVSDLAAVFPTAEGRYLFGPMAILGWGPNALIKLELGLILELPEPVRLLILGRLRVLLPEENNAVVKLQLDSLGVINFTTGDVSLDAVLYDSEIKGFAITGEMALRANFGANPGFLLSVGGFHPAFKTPPGFPALERVAISLAAGDNPRLRLAAYMAITTNTIQFGSLLELYAEAFGFSLEGRLSFDALIQLEPFGLAVGLGAMVAIKFNKAVLFCVSLDANLTGPDPWHVWGEARFVFLGFSASISFNLQIGEKQAPSLPDPVDLYQILEIELENNSNWSTQLPRGEHPLVVLREQPKGVDQMLVHPLADLAINQRIVPLDVNISYFGSALLEGGVQKFSLEVTDAAKSNDLDDWFAPAQYWAMSDDEKLSADSFVRMKSGVQFAKRGYECGQAVEEADMQYEIEPIIDMSKIPVKPASQVRTQKGRALRTPIKSLSHVLEKTFIEQVVSSGAVGIGALQRTGKAKYRNPLEEILEPAFYLKPRVNNQEVYHE